MSRDEKPLAWLHGEVKTPPFSSLARIEAGVLLRRLQRGESIPLPHSRPMPIIDRDRDLQGPAEALRNPMTVTGAAP